MGHQKQHKVIISKYIRMYNSNSGYLKKRNKITILSTIKNLNLI